MTQRIPLILLFALVAAHLGSASARSAEEGSDRTLTLMSYNIKFASRTFKPSWQERRGMQVEMIRRYSPDIIGTQEGLKGQIDDLMYDLPEYVVIGEGRKGGHDDEHMAIFFKKDKFRLREMGSFQLSDTPDIIGSGPEVNPRMVTWARLAFIDRNKGGEENRYSEDYRGHWEGSQEFYVFNTHFFNGRKLFKARESAARLIMERVEPLQPFGYWEENRPLFLMGDFNARPESKVYRTFVGEKGEEDPYLFTDTIEGGSGIDWILYRGNADVLSYEEIDYQVDGVFPSDHDPIFVKMNLRGGN
ncbi:endonuclease/exonuclease/phosphatase family protein [Pelagicoccus mobilis]|uniref:Endonuclease/exonuclease/phosphatase family protein n=1 Tax=Pelagicoccus mobilis TaxID=415221 RepID=A0A934S381_9BACT|nr:endonuclease/exonuclease/phosphatase family protein [Pelagicoccus mobilis]MBK1879841.1 endonuclease/exonuclease/phosphatase family protein [Pelagicoccus mobilis]